MPDFLLIEFPGNVKNLEIALERLTINYTSNTATLQLHPKQPWRPPITGTIRPFRGLVISQRQNDSTTLSQTTSNATSQKVTDDGKSYKVVGTVKKICRFRKMVDFVISPDDKSGNLYQNFFNVCRQLDLTHIDKLASILQDPQWRAMEERRWGIPICTPPEFTPASFPYFKAADWGGMANANFSSTSTAATSSFNTTGNSAISSSRRKTKQAPWVRLYSMSTEASETGPPHEFVVRSRRLYGAALQAVEGLFIERPVWLKLALLEQLPDIGAMELRFVLPTVAYFFSDGPWRGCWIRHGFDPRKTSSAHIYQVVEMRPSRGPSGSTTSRLSELLMKRSLTLKSHQFDGVHLTAQLSQLQFCDITYQPIREFLLRPANLKDQCDRRNGWYKDGVIRQLRQMIRERWLELLRQTDEKLYEFAQRAMQKEDLESTSIIPTGTIIVENQNGDVHRETSPEADPTIDIDEDEGLDVGIVNPFPLADGEEEEDYEIYE